MSLTPVEVEEIEDDIPEEDLPELLPSKTYKLDFLNGKIGPIIDDEEAIKQFIEKAIRTERNRFFIYSDEFGCEREVTLANNPTLEYLKLEMPRVIAEAIEYDDRIESTDNYIVEGNGDQLSVQFDVTLVNGIVIEGVNVNV